MSSFRPSKAMTQPLTAIFRFLQHKARIQIWLYDQVSVRIEGRIIGFDEFMNVVLDDTEEINTKKGSRQALGRIMLKGDNITLISAAPTASSSSATSSSANSSSSSSSSSSSTSGGGT